MLRFAYLCATLLALIGAAGCEMSEPSAPKTVTENKPAPTIAPPGLAPVGEDVLSPKPAGPAAPPADAAAPASSATPAGQPAPAAQPAAPERAPTNVTKVAAKIVNAKEAKQNPNVIEVENKVHGQDPLSIAASAYVSLRSRPQIAAFQSSLRQIKEGEGRTPTFEEFLKLMKQSKVEFVELYPYQMYGYDPDTGGLTILEDTKKKAEIRESLGLPPNGN
jgi:hypothetical protein